MRRKPRCLPCLIILLLLSPASSVPGEPPRSLNYSPAHSPLPLWAALPLILLFGVIFVNMMMAKRTSGASAQPSRKKQRPVDSSWAPFQSTSLQPETHARFHAFVDPDPGASIIHAGELLLVYTTTTTTAETTTPPATTPPAADIHPRRSRYSSVHHPSTCHHSSGWGDIRRGVE